ncbi:MAG: PAC2 family protein [Candidatus Nezhaarchaeota archaeon]|nr:PAC2 family protein [Candidatus Nezhaarchaeota archaeon]MCX8141916.1 PAC2 family protein [Candidatus Nezhaarchaeota archaeon]MDW8050303.1 PAC2 family protein [Nitrososphaerota archaeon]
MSVQVVLREELPSNGVFITGFQGVGITGYIAIKYMISTLSAKPVGFILSNRMPPFVWMEGNRLATPIQLFKYDRCIFMLAEFIPSPPETYNLINNVCKWVSSRFSEALLIGGLDLRVKKEGETEKVKFAATSKAISKVLSQGYRVLEPGLYITGPLALMLMKFEQLDFPAIAILAYANTLRPDPMAAAIAIEYFSKMYGISVNTEQLVKDAQRIEAEIEESIKKRQEKMRSEVGALYI